MINNDRKFNNNVNESNQYNKVLDNCSNGCFLLTFLLKQKRTGKKSQFSIITVVDAAILIVLIVIADYCILPADSVTAEVLPRSKLVQMSWARCEFEPTTKEKNYNISHRCVSKDVDFTVAIDNSGS